MGDEETSEIPTLAPVLADEPVVLQRPRRAVARVAIAYMLAILIVGSAAAYIGATVGYDRASARTDRRIATLEGDLAERRATRDRENATRDAQVKRLRQLVCTFADRVHPRDAEVERVRAEFGCTGNPTPQVAPSSLPSPPAGAGPANPGQPPRGDGRQNPGPPAGAGRDPPSGGQPNPAPQPPAQQPDPPAEPEPEPDDGLICLPILGCLL